MVRIKDHLTYLFHAADLEVYVGVAPVTKLLALSGHFEKKELLFLKIAVRWQKHVHMYLGRTYKCSLTLEVVVFLYLGGCVAKLSIRALGHQSKGVQPLTSILSNLIIQDFVNIVNIYVSSPVDPH